MTIVLSKYLFIIIVLCVFTIFELLQIKSATIGKDELSKYKDNDGLIPIPRTFTRYNIREYYEQYYRIAFIIIYLLHFLLIIITIKVLFYENIEKYYNGCDINILMIAFGLFSIVFLSLGSLIIRVLVMVKSQGIEETKKDSIGFKHFIINKYILATQYVSKTDDIRIANNDLWIQFFINKCFTIILITVLFCIKIVLWKCKVN